ncbi:MAG: 23S rRNA (adenine(2503)-C(2))-methyltransferase RlmN [Planctomycetes bacterium]|nr:23S rRNA (adenine(2503)-C(2))-methyltransferase RlmN [Planctomycetota bacterium]NOG55115.1 23S rRNA (adenine(2503)-C(2))-methyltransferase RlmN [Planctomycetota bacterium]
MIPALDTHHVFAHTPTSLAAQLAELGMPRFRADQILDWVYRKHTFDIAQMSNLSQADRRQLADRLILSSGSILHQQQGSDGTTKLLVQWDEQQTAAQGSEPDVALPLAQAQTAARDPSRETECVMIPASERRASGSGVPVRRTACISSQVGCPVGCTFCASGIGGLDGNLSAGRIVEQVWLLDAQLGSAPRPSRISHVVFMGMGEPLANYRAVVQAVHTLCAEWAFGISGRRITISTVGLPTAIRRLADEDWPAGRPTLALSLHAPDDDLRRQLIPWAEYASIAEILDACAYYFDRTGRESTLEYILLGGVNDSPACAEQLARLCRSLRANVNLIRYNEVDSLPYRRPTSDAVHEFQAVLRRRQVNVHIRASRGRDIAAACGQLRHEGR